MVEPRQTVVKATTPGILVWMKCVMLFIVSPAFCALTISSAPLSLLIKHVECQTGLGPEIKGLEGVSPLGVRVFTHSA